MADPKTQSTQLLQSEHQMIFMKVLELEAEDATKNASAIQLFNGRLLTISTELNKRLSGGEIKAEYQSTSKTNELGKDMRNSLDRITELTPGADTSVFLAALGNCYKNYVEAHPELEERFVKYAVTRLCSAYQTQVHNVTPRITTWGVLKKHVSDSYGQKLTPFQKLDALFELKADADWAGYTAKLQNHADEVLVFLEDNWKKHNPGKDFTVKVLFDLMAAEIFLRRLQDGPDRACYNFICSQLHEVWDLNGAFAKAKGWLDRANRENPLDSTVDLTAFYGHNSKPNHGRQNQPRQQQKPQKPPSNGQQGQPNAAGDPTKANFMPLAIFKKVTPNTCYKWATGRCTKADADCKFQHKWTTADAKKSDADKQAPKPQNSETFFADQGFCL